MSKIESEREPGASRRYTIHQLQRIHSKVELIYLNWQVWGVKLC